MFSMILWQQNLAMGGGPAITRNPTVFLQGNAQRNIGVSGTSQRNVALTGNSQRNVGLTGDAGSNS